MKGLKRNKRKIWYAPYLGREKVRNEPLPIYGKPVKLEANVSPVSGVAQTEIFGVNTAFDRVVYIDDPTVPINETTVFCIDKAPNYTEDERLVFDYKVVCVAKGRTNTLVAVKKELA